MGGPKKPTLSQAIRRQMKQAEAKAQQKQAVKESRQYSISEPPTSEVVSFVSGQKYVTPYILAEKFGIKLSVARGIISNLSKQGVLKEVVGDSMLRVYTPTSLVVETKSTTHEHGHPSKPKKGKKSRS